MKTRNNPYRYPRTSITNAVQCPRCLDVIFARNVFDSVKCSCEGTVLVGTKVEVKLPALYEILDDLEDGKPSIFRLVVPYNETRLMVDAKHGNKLGKVELIFPTVKEDNEE